MTCEKCKDTGKIVDDFTTEQGLTGFASRLCECRANTPRRHGKAAWWNLCEPVSWNFNSGHWLGVTVSVQQELPISKDNYPVFRTAGNCYFRTGAKIEVEGDALISDDLRDLAKFLVDCADKIDAMDTPVKEETE